MVNYCVRKIPNIIYEYVHFLYYSFKNYMNSFFEEQNIPLLYPASLMREQEDIQNDKTVTIHGLANHSKCKGCHNFLCTFHKYCDISFLSQLWYNKEISGEPSENPQKIPNPLH